MSGGRVAERPADLTIGRVRVLFGAGGGKYPDGNSVLVSGSEETAVVDPSLGLSDRRGELPRVERVLLSHCHEDHLAGLHLFPDAACHVHEADLPGLRSLDGMMTIYGYTGDMGQGWRQVLVERFHYVARPDALALRDGDVLELGRTRVRVVHLPGHTRGHCAFLVEPEGVCFLGDVDLSSFGPYYGDAWSDLEDFERSLARVREVEARWYATFHHVGVLEGRAAFLDRLDRFSAVIGRREERLLAFLAAPRGLDEIVAHRFVYRPGDAVPWADAVERRSMGLHLARLVRDDRVREVEPGRFLAAT
jgi:glyoxylase-like metal-dependent hydrolase (beta-lactamase superfamily II)